MEKLTLIPHHHELIINNGSLDGAIDLFSYGPETEETLRPFGSLYIIGHRDTDSSNMGYIVSLIAALARREYYAQPGTAPKDAFARMLKKVNEIVDEFLRSTDVDLSVGIFAIAGGSVMVSKLDKFKILLARDGQTIDILNNVMLFTKEHVERKRFSSIISGSVQAQDRILAYYPAKAITTRERYLKSNLTKLPYAELAEKLEDLGRQHSTFAAALLYVDMVQTSEQATMPSIQPAELTPEPVLAWSPRQSGPTLSPSAGISKPPQQTLPEPEEEIPHIIAAEFALGTRRGQISKLLGRLKFIRLDPRGKAIFIACVALVVITGVFVAKSFLFVDAQGQKIRQTVQGVQDELKLAQTKISQHEPGQARQILMRALATITADDIRTDKDARKLSASLVQAMDTLDNAQTGTLSLVVQIDPQVDQLLLAGWASASQSLWAVAKEADDVLAAMTVAAGGTDNHVIFTQAQPSAVLPFKSGTLILDTTNKKIVRIMDGKSMDFPISTPDTILSASLYEGNLYVLTDHAILKVADLDTNKPVAKQWLTDVNDLATGAVQIYVDGSIWTLGKDGILTTYYKGKKTIQIQTALTPSGNWRLFAGPQDGQLAVGNTDTKRVYIIDQKTGDLVRTLKIETDQTILQIFPGSEGSMLIITKDNKIWKVQ